MNRWTRFAALLLASLLMCGSLYGCGTRNKKAVGICGEYEILYEEVRFEALTYLENHSNCSEEELRNAVEQAILERYAILELCKEYTPSASMTSPELEEMAQSEKEKAITALGDKKEFKEYLKEIHASEHFFETLLIITQMQVDLETAIFAESELKDAKTLLEWLKNGNCVRVRKLVFENIETAEMAREELVADTSLEKLTEMEAFSSAKIYQPDYYYRDLNETDEELAALALEEVGAVSPVLQSNGTSYLLLRVEDDFERLEDYQVVTALERYRESRLTPLIQEVANSLTLTWNDAGNKLIFSEID